jgi:hypothetical protein
MKLKLLGNYGQRDTKWASVLLGYNTLTKYNIGDFGCLITSLGNYIGKTPLEVNDLLKANGGFTTGGGDFIWSKSTVLNLNQTYQSPYYSDALTSQGLAKMKEQLDSGYPLVCHIDFNPATTKDDPHYVLIYGYEGNQFTAYDPWTNSSIDLDVYGGVTRAVIEWRTYDKKLELDNVVNLQGELDICRKRRDDLYNILTNLCTILGIGTDEQMTGLTAEVTKLRDIQEEVEDRDKKLYVANQKIEGLELDIKGLTDSNTELNDTNTTLSKKVDIQGENIKIQETKIGTLTEEVDNLKITLQIKALTGWRKKLAQFLLGL